MLQEIPNGLARRGFKTLKANSHGKKKGAIARAKNIRNKKTTKHWSSK